MKFLKKLMALILAINMAFSGTVPVLAFELEKVGEISPFVSEEETEEKTNEETLKTITLGDFSVAAVGTKALSSSKTALSQKTLIAVPYCGAELTVSVNDGYQACVYSGNNNNKINQNSGWLGADGDGIINYTYILPENSIYMRVSIRKTDGSEITCDDLAKSGVEVSYICENNIVEDNADFAKILEETELPVLIHLSDIHGDIIRAERAAFFADACGADAILASGDLTAYEPDDWGSALFDAVGKYPGVNFVYGIGNHDAKVSASSYQETIYNSYFKENPSTPNGETYYYRDIADKKLRLISVNQQEGAATTSNGGTCYSQAQVDWLVETLKTTPEGYGVVMMYHSPETKIADAADPDYSEFFQVGNRYDKPTNSTSGYSGTFLMDLVDAFMLRKKFTWNYSEKNGESPVTLNADFTDVAEGVEFIAHITGHVHADSITYLPGTICRQLLLGVTCTTSMYGEEGGYYGLADYSDLTREADTQNQDAFNAYIIDRENKTVRVLRVGVKQTVSGETRDDMTIPYSAPFETGDYLFDTEGLVRLDLENVEWVNYGIQEHGVEPTYKPGVRYSSNVIFDVPYEGVTFYIKINSPYELGIRSGETDTTMSTNYYWLNNKSLTSGSKNRGFVYTIPAGHEKFVLSIANVIRDSSGNIVNSDYPINALDLQAAGLEIWYKPFDSEDRDYLFDTEGMVMVDMADVEWVNYGIQAYGTEPTYYPGQRLSANAIFDVPYNRVTFHIKINAPYEMGIRSGETDTTMTTNHYWLNNKSLPSGEKNAGYVYTLPEGHTKWIVSIANVTRNESNNITIHNNPINLDELEAVGLEIWYKPVAEPMTMQYDDRYDVSGKTVEIVDAGKPTSCKVGYGVAEGTPDDAVITLDGEKLIATGIGTAKVRIDGVLYEITVEPAPISLLLLIGQSNMRGSEGNANQSIVCPEGMVYATFGDDRGDAAGIMNVNNAANFAASALTGEYSTVNVNGTTDNLSYYPINSLTEEGNGTFGPDSGFAYEWVKQTGEKVWVVNAAHGGSSITSWQPNATNFKEAVLLFSACQETLKKEIAAGHFTLSHMGYFWCQGCSDYSWTAEKYVTQYLAMHSGLKSSLAFDHDSDESTDSVIFEFAGIIPVRTGHDYNDGYREGTYTDTSDRRFYESFMDLQMTGPRAAQYWMINNPDLPDIWGVCNIGEDWVWMPDGTNGVADYFNAHYENGRVDYETQVAQKEAWYTPTTPAAVHDSIHYNQIGYNEIGKESVRNALIMLGEIEAPETETTVELLGWDGYTEVTEVTASTTGNSGTLVVPKIHPLWEAKNVEFTLSEGIEWNYYDVLANDDSISGTLSNNVTEKSVTVIGHDWSDWERTKEPSPEGSGEENRTCLECGKTEIREVKGVWQIYDLSAHLKELPEHVCRDLNLWNILEHEDVHFTSGKKWGNTSTPVTSITIPVNPGDRLYATSWNKAGENGHATSDGIRLTFFDAYGIALTLGPGESYRKFAANGGYLEAPEGTIAINIAMWYDSEDYEVYILNREHEYKNGICAACGKEGSVIPEGWEAVPFSASENSKHLAYKIENGVLTFSDFGKGSEEEYGNLPNYSNLSRENPTDFTIAEWYQRRKEITKVVFDETISYIGSYVLTNMDEITEIHIENPEAQIRTSAVLFSTTAREESLSIYAASTIKTVDYWIRGNGNRKISAAIKNPTLYYTDFEYLVPELRELEEALLKGGEIDNEILYRALVLVTDIPQNEFDISDYKVAIPGAENILEILWSISSGTCGENLEYKLSAMKEEDKLNLVISGSGAMEEYSAAEEAPWYGVMDCISDVTVGEEVTSVSEKALPENAVYHVYLNSEIYAVVSEKGYDIRIDELRILCIGNSHTADYSEFIGNILADAENAGLETEITVTRAIIGSIGLYSGRNSNANATYRSHLAAVNGGAGAYSYLKNNRYDLVIVQDYMESVVDTPDVFTKGIASFIQKVKAVAAENGKGTPQIAWFADWVDIRSAGGDSALRDGEGNKISLEVLSREEVYEKSLANIAAVEKEIADKTENMPDFVIHGSTFKQNAMSSYFGTTKIFDKNGYCIIERDTTHLTYELGRYLFAAGVVSEIMNNYNDILVLSDGKIDIGAALTLENGPDAEGSGSQYSGAVNGDVLAVIREVIASPDEFRQSAYTVDPVDSFTEKICETDWNIENAENKEDVLEAVTETINSLYGKDVETFEVEMAEYISADDFTFKVYASHGYSVKEIEIKVHSHNYEFLVTEPTCTEQGYTTYTCECGDSYIDDYVEATGHSFGEWYTTKDATFTEDGEECRECTKCSHVEFRSVPLTVITSGNFGYGTEPTDKVIYTIYSNGTMVVEGEGKTFYCNYNATGQPFKDYRNQIKNLIIGEGITVISRGSFAYFPNLETVSFPSTLTEIQGNGFMASFVKSVSSITIPKSVEKIGVTAFGYTSGTFFTDITIENPDMNFPDKSNSYYHAVFNHGRNPGRTTLYSYGKDNNVSRYADNIGANYIDLDDYLVGEANGIDYRYYDGVLTLSTDSEGVLIPSENAPWHEHRGEITKIVIEEGITGISANAFADYTALEKVEMSDGIKSIGNGAFAVTEGEFAPLKIKFPKRIEEIGKDIFAGRGTVEVTAYYGSIAENFAEPGVNLVFKKQFKMLMIGNSLTNDAANRHQGMTQSQLLDMLQAMLGKDAEITIGVIFNGGRSVSWYATQTELGTKHTLGIISSDNNIWGSAGSFTMEEALSWTDWDAVSLQPYSLNTASGAENVYYPEEVDEKFIPLETASEYMLDCIGKYAPYAGAFCYMHWSMAYKTEIDASLSTYNKFKEFYPEVLSYEGTESGNKFKNIVPVGLSVQNARTTYLALLSYNTTAYADGNLNLTTDAQIGLQRDSVHLSFNIGRYIAGLTFAETIIPEELRAEGYVLPDIRITESVGKLPKEYTEIAQKSVFAAVESWKNGSLAVTEIEGYKVDPVDTESEKLAETKIEIPFAADADSLKERIFEAVLKILPSDFAVESVEFAEGFEISGAGQEFEVEVKIRFGYMSKTVSVPVKVTKALIGDINLDGSVNVKDAYYARLVAAKLIKPTDEQITLGDVDSDGKITAIDANIIRKFVVKIITSLPVGQ